MQEIDDIFKDWTKELLIPKKNDVLVNVLDSSRTIVLPKPSEKYILDENSESRKLVNEAKKERRLNGNETLGVSQFVIRFHDNNKIYSCATTITPCLVEYSKWEKKYVIIPQEVAVYVNPVLIKLFGISSEMNHEEIIEELKDQKLDFQLEETVVLANFHPHRFILLREIEQIQEKGANNNLKSFLGLGEKPQYTIELTDNNLVSANSQQEKIPHLLKDENVVIQGPPGTGKSQVILNLIGKALSSNKTVALVSEKIAALEVIQKKLGEIGLNKFSQNILASNSKEFIYSLKSTWEFLEKASVKQPNTQLVSDLKLNQFDLKIERLQQSKLIGGLDFSTFFQKKPIETISKQLVLNPIDIPKWEEQKVILNQLSTSGLNLFGDWTQLKLNINSDQQFLENLDKGSQKISEIIKQLSAENWTLKNLETEMKKSALCSLFFQNDQEINPELYDADSSKYKKFVKLSRQFKKLQEEVEFLESEKENWKKNLNLSEIQSFTDALLEEDKWGIRKFSVKRKIKKLANAPIDAAVKSLENLKRLKETENKLISCKDGLRKLNIEPDSIEIERLNFVFSKIHNSDKNVFSKIQSLTKKERFALKENSIHLQELYQFFTKNYRENQSKTLLELNSIFQSNLKVVIQHKALIEKLELGTIDLLYQFDSLEKIESVLYYSHFTHFQGLFPELANYDGAKLLSEIQSIQEQENIEFKNSAGTIAYNIKSKFDSFEKLLQTPANKLSAEDKTLKKSLRKGKSILVKEFGKSKQHWTPLQLMQSEAAVWINTLQPIVIATTYKLAESFPMVENLFDLMLIDEASQMVSSHAAGAIFRSKRIAIAGDQEQMAPSFLFQSENATSDALHQAQYNWTNIQLKHHYRSNHSALIEFSNTYFYNGELLVFPSPQNNEKVIEVIELDGVYAERKNDKEAIEVAHWIERQLIEKNYDFGVAAFSEKQLNAIKNKVDPKYQVELDDLIADGLLFKSIENIQGDECDDLIISLGYAKNEEGKFLLQMGPLNKENGHRRLNVLASRARKSITLVKSVSSSEIPLSENEGVNMLRKMLNYFENASSSAEIKMPYNLDYTIEGSQLTLQHPHLKINSGRELYSVVSTLISKGWNVLVDL